MSNEQLFAHLSHTLNALSMAESWLKAQHSENKDHGIRSHHFMGNRWGNSGNSARLYFFRLQIKDAYSLEGKL